VLVLKNNDAEFWWARHTRTAARSVFIEHRARETILKRQFVFKMDYITVFRWNFIERAIGSVENA
jgi:hypothetical protein